MEQSILKSTKKILNIAPEDPSFDLDIATHINAAFSHLHQLGVGPQAGFGIEGDEQKWTDFLPSSEDLALLNAVKTNVYLRVRLVFDPPATTHVAKALELQLTESDWRINTMREENNWVHPNQAAVLVIDGGDPSDEYE